jgi:hypothetical protein
MMTRQEFLRSLAGLSAGAFVVACSKSDGTPETEFSSWEKVEGGGYALGRALSSSGGLVEISKPPANIDDAKSIELTPGMMDAGKSAYVLGDKLYVHSWASEGGEFSRWSVLTRTNLSAQVA